MPRRPSSFGGYFTMPLKEIKKDPISPKAWGKAFVKPWMALLMPTRRRRKHVAWQDPELLMGKGPTPEERAISSFLTKAKGATAPQPLAAERYSPVAGYQPTPFRAPQFGTGISPGGK